MDGLNYLIIYFCFFLFYFFSSLHFWSKITLIEKRLKEKECIEQENESEWVSEWKREKQWKVIMLQWKNNMCVEKEELVMCIHISDHTLTERLMWIGNEGKLFETMLRWDQKERISHSRLRNTREIYHFKWKLRNSKRHCIKSLFRFVFHHFILIKLVEHKKNPI